MRHIRARIAQRVRLLSLFVFAIAVTALLGCSKRDMSKMQTVLDRISHSPESDLPRLLYGYRESSAGAREVLVSMLRPLRSPSPEQRMTVVDARRSGRFTMIVARVPWSRGEQAAGLQPIIVTGEAGMEQVVG